MTSPKALPLRLFLWSSVEGFAETGGRGRLLDGESTPKGRRAFVALAALASLLNVEMFSLAAAEVKGEPGGDALMGDRSIIGGTTGRLRGCTTVKVRVHGAR